MERATRSGRVRRARTTLLRGLGDRDDSSLGADRVLVLSDGPNVRRRLRVRARGRLHVRHRASVRGRIDLRRAAGAERPLVPRVYTMRHVWMALALLACSEAHGGSDASVCAWQPRPPVMLDCTTVQTEACIAWASGLGPNAIARCEPAAAVGAACVSASTCDGPGLCRCGAGDPCPDGSACIADGSSFRCRACGP